ncbi:mannose-6-phosphate isomerase-like [Asterias rubens]|uniref:mannose-6-phosphate isomerase-like n=1 Tax=Asterias rubens TaxID=7604 RepID=UPI0014551D76|nr:mannose-6-phosphate isomerase-like [Asterias rubens]
MGSLVSKKKQTPPTEEAQQPPQETPAAKTQPPASPETQPPEEVEAQPPKAEAEADAEKPKESPPTSPPTAEGKEDSKPASNVSTPVKIPEITVDTSPPVDGSADEEEPPTVTPIAVALKCAVQQYAWGRIGEDSEVATLTQASDPDFQLRADEPYAELWMGTHGKGPSIVVGEDSKPLKDWIQANPDCLGDKVRSKFNAQLPFLFKVLSVNKALSIQAHPHKELAETLRAEHPENYPDDNHKPEMAIALTAFEGLNGFRPLTEIDEFLKTVPEFRAVVGEDNAAKLTAELETGGNDGKSVLKECFTGLMTREAEVIKTQLDLLVKRLEAQESESSHRELLLRLNSQFPGDVGCFCSYFLNHIILQPGEAMFLGPNEPHAYLSGNCMECMACSDNVVRAGLTPKFKDVENLCKMLTYISSPAQDKLFPSVTDPGDSCVTVYDPPVPDFAVARIKVSEGVESYAVTAYDSASILITISGQAEASHPSFGNGKTLTLKKGSVTFLSANHSLPLKLEKSEGFLSFRAYCPLA